MADVGLRACTRSCRIAAPGERGLGGLRLPISPGGPRAQCVGAAAELPRGHNWPAASLRVAAGPSASWLLRPKGLLPAAAAIWLHALPLGPAEESGRFGNGDARFVAAAASKREEPPGATEQGGERRAVASPKAGRGRGPAAPLLVFGADGNLQLTARSDTEAAHVASPEPREREPAGKAGKDGRNRKGGQGPKAAAPMSAPEAEVAWKDGSGPGERPARRAPAGAPRYSKAARRFYNERFREAERLSKVLASAGVASRRACEEMIFAGRVTVNGRVCTVPQTPVDLMRDNIYIDGRSLPKKLPPKLYFAVNKPKGYICSSSDVRAAAGEERGGKTALSLVDEYMAVWRRKNPGVPAPRLFTVGRLDVATTGLLFITNDGEWAQRVAHPSSGLTKEYTVAVSSKVTRRQLGLMQQGVDIDGARCTPLLVELVDEAAGASQGDFKQRLRLVVSEGRNREVRRIVESAGLTVVSLKRVRIGGLRLPRGLGLGKYKVLDASEAQKLVSGGS